MDKKKNVPVVIINNGKEGTIEVHRYNWRFKLFGPGPKTFLSCCFASDGKGKEYAINYAKQQLFGKREIVEYTTLSP